MIQTSIKTQGQVRITSRQFIPDPTGLESNAENEPVAKIAPAAKKKKSQEDDTK